jgi:hypothetical protein
MPKNSPGKSYISDRDSTSGRNAEQDMSALDRAHANHPARMGTNVNSHDFHHGENIGHDAAPRNEDERPRQSFEKPLTTGTASEFAEKLRQDRVDREHDLKTLAEQSNRDVDPFKPFDPRG